MAKVNEKAWEALVALANARTTCKSRESELVQNRKDLENQLDNLGAGDTEKHLRVSRDYVVTLRQIEFERDRLKTLADQMEKTISDAIQGKFEFAEELDERKLVKRPSEKELFHAAEEKPKETRPVGRPGPKPKPEQPDPSKGDGVDEHLNASVNELDLRENIKSKLIDAKLTTIAHLARLLDMDKGIRDFANLNENQDSDVKKAVKKYRTEHRKAMREAEAPVL